MNIASRCTAQRCGAVQRPKWNVANSSPVRILLIVQRRWRAVEAVSTLQPQCTGLDSVHDWQPWHICSLHVASACLQRYSHSDWQLSPNPILNLLNYDKKNLRKKEGKNITQLQDRKRSKSYLNSPFALWNSLTYIYENIYPNCYGQFSLIIYSEFQTISLAEKNFSLLQYIDDRIASTQFVQYIGNSSSCRRDINPTVYTAHCHKLVHRVSPHVRMRVMSHNNGN